MLIPAFRKVSKYVFRSPNERLLNVGAYQTQGLPAAGWGAVSKNAGCPATVKVSTALAGRALARKARARRARSGGMPMGFETGNGELWGVGTGMCVAQR
jgi:hypothetical protein